MATLLAPTLTAHDKETTEQIQKLDDMASEYAIAVWADNGDILLPSVHEQRRLLKLKDHTISADAPPPDIYRLGRLVAGEIEVPEGYFVLFNRHDSEEFEHEGKTYHRINNLNALAYVSPEELSL